MKRLLNSELRAIFKRLGEEKEKRERRQAQFLARLLSIPSLEALPDDERVRPLTEARKRSGFRSAKCAERLLWPLLQHTHEIAYPVLHSLLDGKPTSLQPLGERERIVLVLDPKAWNTLKFPGNGHLDLQYPNHEYWQEEMILTLWLLLRSQWVPFPFRRCPHCKTGVFFVFGTRKYCSRECTSQANEAARKGMRNEYMREHMAKKRKWAKAR
jgi:hypothetical protein